MLLIYTTATLPEAQMLVERMQQAGITALVLNSYAQGATGEIPVDQAYPQIWLENVEDQSRAMEIIQEYESIPLNLDWVFCRHCSERNPGNFDVCWKCGKEMKW